MATSDAQTQLQQMKDDHRANTYRNVDIRLSSILDLTFDLDDSNTDGKLSLTVVADGAVISGTVISEDAWAEAQAIKSEANSPKFAAALRVLQDGAVEGRAKRNADAANSDEHRALRTKIHFDNASIIMGGTTVTTNGLRVDLKHVSAWMLGEMSKQD